MPGNPFQDYDKGASLIDFARDRNGTFMHGYYTSYQIESDSVSRPFVSDPEYDSCTRILFCPLF